MCIAEGGSGVKGHLLDALVNDDLRVAEKGANNLIVALGGGDPEWGVTVTVGQVHITPC